MYWKIVAGLVGIILVGMSLNAAIRWKSLLTGIIGPSRHWAASFSIRTGIYIRIHLAHVLLGRQNLLDKAEINVSFFYQRTDGYILVGPESPF